MQWRTASMVIFATSLFICCMVIPVLPARGETASTAQPEPSPRPPLPTAKPRHGHGSESSNEIGRITGTVIESSTGSPAAGINVDVGGVIVVSDQNGNYERYLPVGTYAVTLVLGDQGTPDQPTQTVQVNADQATIQHLRYTRMRVVATPEPSINLPGSVVDVCSRIAGVQAAPHIPLHCAGSN